MISEGLREKGVQPITNSKIGAKLVRIMTEGLIGVCDQNNIPYPTTLDDFENTLVELSRETKFQAGLSFTHEESHRDFYELLGINRNLAGTPYNLLIKLAELSPQINRGLKLISGFATSANPEQREQVLASNAKIFREFGGEDFELIAQAFENGDCQRNLVFEEMLIILEERKKE